jgi:hypothetical protein
LTAINGLQCQVEQASGNGNHNRNARHCQQQHITPPRIFHYSARPLINICTAPDLGQLAQSTNKQLRTSSDKLVNTTGQIFVELEAVLRDPSTSKAESSRHKSGKRELQAVVDDVEDVGRKAKK